ncbi:hypothetical protein PR002_g25956 [Phytophthora rubi]|uniref:Uncharacterized protein n=1 Tax=Phytophthora rubi TaxID=129364 RepID=A0A6A3I1Q9_9STRA|nr:hypothetical protein PR002_g25956 [Phytophthora rubi]
MSAVVTFALGLRSFSSGSGRSRSLRSLCSSARSWKYTVVAASSKKLISSRIHRAKDSRSRCTGSATKSRDSALNALSKSR